VDRCHCSNRVLEKIEEMFSRAQVPCRLEKFTSKQHSIEAISQAKAQGYDTLIMGGGDGTIHNLFNLAFEKDFTFGIIPLGTVNALADSLGIPVDPEEACRVILEGNVRKIDVGRAAGRLFTCFGSVGFDASVVHTIDPESKVRWERIAFGCQGVKRLFYLDELAPFDVTIQPSGKTLRGYSMIVSNIPNYAGFNFFSEKPDDGKMEILVFKKNTVYDYLVSVAQMGISGPTAGMEENDNLFRSKVTSLTVKSDKSLFFQLDGEAISLSPGEELVFEIMPRVARFLSPKTVGGQTI
jgi:diacylglycerol kinase family enzyme